jgi:hypothetical protein
MQSELHYFRFIYGTESRLVWALVIFLMGLAVGSLPSAVVQALTQYGVITGALALGAGGVRTFRKWRNITLIPRPLPAAVSELTRAQWQATEPVFTHTLAHPLHEGTLIWADDAVNEALRRSSADVTTIPGAFDPHPFELPARLRTIAALSLRSRNAVTREVVTRTAPRPIRFNGRLLRLDTEPTIAQIAGGELVFSPVSYFDGECSNELWNLADRASDVDGLIDEFVLARDLQIRPLEHAQVANIVGISILAMTNDDQLIFVRQAPGNSIAPRALASSGSGSLEARDLKALPGRGAAPFSASALLMQGMLREMSEESLVRADEVIMESAHLTGYFRWVNRGFKPEFTGFTRVGVSAVDLQARKHAGAETAFTRQLVFVPASALAAAARARDEAADPQSRWAAAVTPLRAALGTQSQSGMSPSAEAAWVYAAASLRAMRQER